MPDRGCSRWKLLPKLSVNGLWHAQKLRTVGGAGSTFPGLGSAWGPRASQSDSFKVLSCQMSAAVLHPSVSGFAIRSVLVSLRDVCFVKRGACEVKMMLQAGASVASHNLVLPGYKVEVSSLGQGFAKRLQNLRDTFEQNHLSLQARGLTVHAAIHALAHGCIFATKLCHRLSILDSPHKEK